MTYSQRKGFVRKNLKKSIREEIEVLETDMNQPEIDSTARLQHLKQVLNRLEQNEIEGYKIRIKFLPSFEQDEPDIAFFPK